ncbi:MAG: alkaline phosphatase family protein [Gemmatimonadetes bacterium]|nr:alkaline phosphatase family protein [Gemmatimonadota bacterium]
MHRRLLETVATVVAIAVPAPGAAQRPPANTEPPRLVVMITVDQLKEEYLDKYARQLTGGLARLTRGGAFFTNAFQDHAITETAPGHASTMSGRFPRGTGIVRNSAGVNDPQSPLVGGPGPGASPFRFRGGTFTDWLRVADPGSRALSVSRKDRGAILPLGRAHQQAFWYSTNGNFVTSTYYADSLPTWVQRFNARGTPRAMAGEAWTLLRPASEYAEPDSVPAESGGRDYVFPHVLPSDPDAAARSFMEYPFMDQLTLDLALEGVQALGLGAGPHTDVLAVSLSTTDAVGHRYGPDSREIHDQILRLDQMLGVFIDSLYALRDSARIVFALTADHGVSPMPEVRAASPEAARGAYVDLGPLAAEMSRSLAGRGLEKGALAFEDGVLIVDYAAFARARVDVDSVVRAFRAAALRTPGVARADLMSELWAGDTIKDAVSRRWVHMIPRDQPIPLVVTLKPGHVWGGPGFAHHGQPIDQDAHVPVIFYGPPFRPGRYTGFARVVDIAPTLAWVTGIRPTEPLDGRILRDALREPPPAAARAALGNR